MPRQSRLDIPGLLQHVIVRGIERRKIFRDDTDRTLFTNRLSYLLTETNTDCLAWALIPNHFHLLLRPNRCTLKEFMRRLLTGYAINFNHRYKRSGHVFQNRYKSIVCEEETYLLELVRYIHLNPIRAKLVRNLDELATYSWCGHVVLLGQRELPGQSTDEVLARFGNNQRLGRKRYVDFVHDGLALGRRNELVGGGLRRSTQASMEQTPDEIGCFDERVLGSSEYVGQLRQEQQLRERMIPAISLPELLERVAKTQGLETAALRTRGKDARIKTGRDLFCYIAVRLLKHSGTDTGLELGIKRAAVSHAVHRGEEKAAAQQSLITEIFVLD